MKVYNSYQDNWLNFVLQHNHGANFCGYVPDTLSETKKAINSMESYYIVLVTAKQDDKKKLGLALVEQYQSDHKWISEVWGPFSSEKTFQQQIIDFICAKEHYHNVNFFGSNLKEFFSKTADHFSVKIQEHEQLTIRISDVVEKIPLHKENFKLKNFLLSDKNVGIKQVLVDCESILQHEFSGYGSFSEFLNYDHATLTCCYLGTSLVAFALYYFDKNNIFLEYIIVEPQYRQTGVASSILEEIITNNANKDLIELNWPTIKKPAGLFYQKMGFKVRKKLASIQVSSSNDQ